VPSIVSTMSLCLISTIYIKTSSTDLVVGFAALDEFVHQVLSSRFCGEKPGGNPMF